MLLSLFSGSGRELKHLEIVYRSFLSSNGQIIVQHLVHIIVHVDEIQS